MSELTLSRLDGCGCAALADAPQPFRQDLPCGLQAEQATEYLERKGSQRGAGPNQLIYIGSEMEHRCFRLLEGVVRLVHIPPDGQRQIARLVFAGDFFGLTEIERSLSAEAVTQVRVLEYDIGRLQRLSDCNPRLGRQLTLALKESASSALEHVTLLNRRGMHQRLALFLLMLHRRLGIADLVSVPMSRGDIGAYVGLTTESVSRAFTDLRQQGIVENVNRTMVRLDLARLTDLAGLGETPASY